MPNEQNYNGKVANTYIQLWVEMKNVFIEFFSFVS